MVVKLIDVYPEDADGGSTELGGGEAPRPDASSMNGYELPIAMEVRRGRFLDSFEHPTALTPDAPRAWNVPLRDRDHVFRKGHRIMVQVQSSWFPVIDRNPQRFVPSIYEAKDSDFVKATQHVYATPDMPSHVTLPLLP
jgi:predicted acyl esterase